MSQQSVKRQLIQFLAWPHQYRAESSTLGIGWRKGCLLHGPPGVGKTSLVQMAAKETGAVLLELKAADLAKSSLGESEGVLRRAFQKACNVPSGRVAVIFVDEIDAICPQRSHASVHEVRLVAQLLTLLDGSDVTNPAIRLIAATNLLTGVDSALRRPGRIDLEIFVPPPDRLDRLYILERIMQNFSFAAGVDLEGIASSCQGYTSADLHSLGSEVALKALYDVASNAVGTESAIEFAQVTTEDFSAVMMSRAPTLLRSMYADAPQNMWEAIQGYSVVKRQVMQAVQWPFLHSSTFARLGAKVPKGVLLYGPSGCCKTSLAHGIAAFCKFNLITLSAAQLHSMYVGVGESALSHTFRHARLAAPTILLFDDLDMLFEARNMDLSQARNSSMLATMLMELDGLEVAAGIIVIATTNKPWRIDNALLRPGRFDSRIYVPPPDTCSRLAILSSCTESMPCNDNLEFHGLLSMSEGWTCSELKGVYKEASRIAMRRTKCSRERPCVAKEDLMDAVTDFVPSMISTLSYLTWAMKN